MAQKFMNIMTKTGMADFVNAQVYSQKVPFTHMAVGDGGGNEVQIDENRTALVREVFRSPISSITADEDNPNWLRVQAIIPANVGGWYIREVGLIGGLNDDISQTPETPGSKLLFYGNHPESYKPNVSEGTSKDVVITMIIQVANTELVNFSIDPSMAVATTESVDKKLAAHKAETSPHPNRYAPIAHVNDENAHGNLKHYNDPAAHTKLFSLLKEALEEADGMLEADLKNYTNTKVQEFVAASTALINASAIIWKTGLGRYGEDVIGQTVYHYGARFTRQNNTTFDVDLYQVIVNCHCNCDCGCGGGE
jgi:phage-related tail fiber protein